MSTTQTSREIARAGVTIATVLFGDATIPPRPWRSRPRGLRWSTAPGQALDAPACGQRDSAAREIRGAAVNLLGLRLGDVLFVAWRRASGAGRGGSSDGAESRARRNWSSSRPTASPPPTTPTWTSSSTRCKLATLHFDLSLVFDIDSLLATVRAGPVGRAGQRAMCAAASLACEGPELASRQSVSRSAGDP